MIDIDNITTDQLDALAQIMDDDTREQIHSDSAPCTPGEFLRAYLALRPEFAQVLAQYGVDSGGLDNADLN